MHGVEHLTNLDAFSGQHYVGLMGADTLDPITKKRSYAAKTYLAQAKSRENLTVCTGVLLNKVVFTDSLKSHGNIQATGLQYTTKSKETGAVTANNQVIITAGTIGSPKLLELSGG